MIIFSYKKRTRLYRSICRTKRIVDKITLIIAWMINYIKSFNMTMICYRILKSSWQMWLRSCSKSQMIIRDNLYRVTAKLLLIQYRIKMTMKILKKKVTLKKTLMSTIKPKTIKLTIQISLVKTLIKKRFTKRVLRKMICY